MQHLVNWSFTLIMHNTMSTVKTAETMASYCMSSSFLTFCFWKYWKQGKTLGQSDNGNTKLKCYIYG